MRASLRHGLPFAAIFGLVGVSMAFWPAYLADRGLTPSYIGLLLSAAKLGPGSYRLARIQEVHPDARGVVRTVTIAFPSRRKRGHQGRQEEMRMGVQRLAVLLPVEEQWQEQ